MNQKCIRLVKWWSLIISAFLFLEEVIFRDSFLGLAKSSLFFRSQNKDDKDNIIGARKLLENGDGWGIFPNPYFSNDESSRLPTCVIIGARKCGTRALLEFLDLHPQIVIHLDEMHFFSNDNNYMMGVDWYRSKMPLSTADQITVEKTPRYFISPSAPARMHRMNSSIKIIVILRNPTTRVVSDFTQIYTQNIARNESMKSFDSTVFDVRKGHVNLDYKALQVSVYHQHISRWLEFFPLSQIHIVDGDALIKTPISEIKKVETFLGLKHEISADQLYYNNTRGFYCMRQSDTRPERCLGANKGRKHIEINDWVKERLNNYFKPHNEILFKLIKRRFHWR